MILKDGKTWDGWKELLGKKFSLEDDAIFVLTDNYKGKKEVKPGIYADVYAPSVMIEAGFTWIDPKELTTHEIRYCERVLPDQSRNNKGGDQIGKYTPLMIEFTNGVVRVSKKKLDFYWYMTIHKDNMSNEIYKDDQIRATRTRPFVFKQKNEAAENLAALTKEMQMIEAVAMVRNGMSVQEMRELYATYGPKDGFTVSENKMKLFLISQAKANPVDFVSRAKGDDKRYMAIVKDAETLKVTCFVSQTRYWKYVESGQSIMSPIKGEDKYRSFVNFLRRPENEDVLKLIEEALSLKREMAIAPKE